MPRRRKQAAKDYPSPETIGSSDDYDPCHTSPDSSFTSPTRPEQAKVLTGPGPREEEREAEEHEGIDNEPSAQVQGALALVRAHAHGEPLPLEDGQSAEWIELEITPSEYRRLVDDFEEDGLLGTFRHDYDPRSCLLVLRLMHSLIHEAFEFNLCKRIWTWLDQLQADHTQHNLVREAISNINGGGHANIRMMVDISTSSKEKSAATKSPDGQFAYLGYRHPPFTFEVAYSQPEKCLPRLAKQYYEDTNGDIKTVLTFDLEYTPKARRRQERGLGRTRSASQRQKARETKQASFSLYRGPERIISEQPFRDECGRLVEGDGITLYVSDFIPDAVVDSLSKDLRRHGAGEDHSLEQPGLALHITSQELFKSLAQSEALQAARDKTRTPSPAPQKKRKVNWALEEDDDQIEDKEELDEAPSGRSASASSKRRRLSSDLTYSSGAKPTTALGVRTRSQSRGH